jgi:Domain of unknown function (DUF4160)
VEHREETASEATGGADLPEHGVRGVWRCSSLFRASRKGTASGIVEFARGSARVNPTVFREGPSRFFFFSREEERIHVHVETANSEAKFWIEPSIELAGTTN